MGHCDYTMTFTVGQDDFGWAIGSHSEKFLGTVLDLTGAKVFLSLFRLPTTPSVLDLAAGYGQGYECEIFKNAGVLDADPAKGIFSVDISANDLDVYGQVIGEIKVETSSGKTICPGQFKTKIIKRLSS